MYCEPCEQNGDVKLAETWCIECEERYCETCVKYHKVTKISKHHQLISIADRHKAGSLEIKRNCNEHQKKLGFFCTQHDTILCLKCVQLFHSSCDILELNDASKGVKTSTALLDLESSIKELLENLETSIHSCKEAGDELKLQKEKIEMKIQNFREKINKKLDTLQQQIMQEVKSCFEKHQLQLVEYQNNFLFQEKKLMERKEKTYVLKAFASDAQALIGIKEIGASVLKDKQFIKEAVSKFPVHTLTISVDSQLESIVTELNKFGAIKDETSVCAKYYIEPKDKQVRHSDMCVPVSQQRKKFKLNLKEKIVIQSGYHTMNLTSCVILPNNKLMFADGNNKRLIIHDENGGFEHYIKLTDQPFDVTVVNESTVYVTFRRKSENKNIFVAYDYNTYRLRETISISAEKDSISLWGISHNDECELFIVTYPEGIKILSDDKRVEKLIPINIHNVYNLTINKDKIYLTSRDNNTLHCYNTFGKKLWTFTDEKLKSSSNSSVPLTADSQGNIYLACPLEDVVLLVSKDGKHHKTVLDRSDDINNPRGIFFDKKTSRLLVCSQDSGHAALYDVVGGHECF